MMMLIKQRQIFQQWKFVEKRTCKESHQNSLVILNIKKEKRNTGSIPMKQCQSKEVIQIERERKTQKKMSNRIKIYLTQNHK